jgi:hypothetical protein
VRFRLALLIALVLAACSSNSKDANDPSSTAPTVGPTTTTRVESSPAAVPLDCENWRYGPADEPAAGVLPVEFDRNNYKRTSLRDERFAANPADHCGQKGAAVDLAWGITQGRDDVRIAVLDSGIKWRDSGAMADLATKAYINVAEARPGCEATHGDCNGDGVFDITDFGSIIDYNLNGLVDPEDLILDPARNDGRDNDNNGYVDDISGWDFLYGDNNPLDTVEYGHGTGEALDSTAAANGTGDVGTCPKCRFIPVRVSDSFIADGGRFANGVDFAVASDAVVVQEALGAVTNPSSAQTSIDAAYDADVVVVASMADEASKHANLPALLRHTLAVNSVTEKEPLLGGDVEGYLALNGCTNYGGITLVSVPSSSCSSEATGIMSGVVGLVISAARDADIDLSAGEIIQIARARADDVDFSGDYGESQGGLIDTVRYPTSPGWDATFGYGRINAYEMVKAARDGNIPPTVDIIEPRWFDITADSFEVQVDIDASRAESYDVRIEWARGLQPPEGPTPDEWHVVIDEQARTEPATLTANIDLTDVVSSDEPYDDDAHRPAEDRHSVRVRVVVTTGDDVAIDQRQVFAHDDVHSPRMMRVAGAATSSPVFAQLDADPGDELLVATDDGAIHAYDVSGDELPGFPIESAAGSAFMVGAPQVLDLDGEPGNEIVASDFDGNVWAWHVDATVVPGFPVGVNEAYSRDEVAAQNRFNRTKPQIYAQPAVADLDGDDRPEIVVAAADRHVYAWHANAQPVAGFPVQLVDPTKVTSIDPTTHKVTFKADSGVGDGGELVAPPVIGDVDGDGNPDIVVGAQEQYAEAINVGAEAPEDGGDVLGLIAAASTLGNTRLYAIDNTGEYLDGWPVKLGMIALEVLPTIGGGVATGAVIADVHPNPGNEVIAASAAGPGYVFGGDGVSVYGQVDGHDRPLAWSGGLDGAGLARWGAARTTTDTVASFVSFGGPSVGDLDGDGDMDIAAPGGGLTRLLDVQAPDLQLPNDDHLLAWDATTGDMLAGFPHTTSDIAFFVTPAIADVDGDGTMEVVAGNGLNVLSAVHADGTIPVGWPKLTGGWVVGTPAFGDLENDGRPEIAIVRRDGVLMIWSASG